MASVYDCPEEVRAQLTKEEQALWLALYKDLTVTDYLPDGVHVVRGTIHTLARKLATKLMWLIRRHKEQFSDALRSVREQG